MATILLFHGMTSSPVELASLIDALRTKGHEVHAPLLPGHDRNDKNVEERLRAISTEEYLRFAVSELNSTTQSGKSIIVGGLSFGSLLALYLATQFSGKVSRLLLFSPPLLFKPPMKEFALDIISTLPNLGQIGEWVLSKLPLVDKVERKDAVFSFPRSCLPIHSVGAGGRVVRIRKLALKSLDMLQIKVLVIQDPFDHLLSNAELQKFKALQERGLLTLVLIAGGEHELAIGPRYGEVASHTIKFIEEV